MHLLFALNFHYAERHIINVNLRCDFFNTLVCFRANYTYEIWVDFKKIKAIEVMYRGFLKSLLKVQKTLGISIVLVEFSKIPF
jgi:hypothetical protein